MKCTCTDGDGYERGAYLMVREDQSIGDHYVLSPARSENYNFGDVVRR